jgi:hypothetical protein
MLDKRIQKRQKFTMDTLQRMPELACRATDGSPGCVADQLQLQPTTIYN